MWTFQENAVAAYGSDLIEIYTEETVILTVNSNIELLRKRILRNSASELSKVSTWRGIPLY